MHLELTKWHPTYLQKLSQQIDLFFFHVFIMVCSLLVDLGTLCLLFPWRYASVSPTHVTAQKETDSECVLPAIGWNPAILVSSLLLSFI